jgi:hypothetical protein
MNGVVVETAAIEVVAVTSLAEVSDKAVTA